MNFKEYIHAREHSAMGYGPMHTCVLCNQNKPAQLGEAVQTPVFSREDLKKLLVATTISTIIGGIVSELIVRRFIFKRHS